MTEITLRGGPRDGQTVERGDGINLINVPILSPDARWMHCATYDAHSGELLKESDPTPFAQPHIGRAWDYEAIENRGWFERLRRAVGLRIAGLDESDLDRDDW